MEALPADYRKAKLLKLGQVDYRICMTISNLITEGERNLQEKGKRGLKRPPQRL